jgi:hypothetical protein
MLVVKDCSQPKSPVIYTSYLLLDSIVQCPVCRTTLKGWTIKCARCDTAHHYDCWHFTGHCSTYQCASIVSESSKKWLIPKSFWISHYKRESFESIGVFFGSLSLSFLAEGCLPFINLFFAMWAALCWFVLSSREKGFLE